MKTAKWCCNISGRDASESRPAVSLQRRMMIMKKRSTKEIKLQAKKALQGHVGTVILGLLAVYGLNTLGTILSTNLFSGTSALDLVLSEIFMLVVSLIVGIISAGLGYMLLNISRGQGVFSGRSGLLFQKPARQGDRCRLCAGADPAGHSNPLLLCELYHRSGTDCGFPDPVAFHDSGTAGCKHVC